ncbi:MAG TPA: dTDP-4-dehydrorhamnose 3,5-epimerase [Acidimicrobiales bacterium]|nr:dTDP-4-dehydrorhamnose 3,5-epimerase [Acidimicrobiales bacterium]
MGVTPFEASPTEVEGLWTITVKTVAEPRGAVRELYRAGAYAEALGLPPSPPWAQVNVTETRRGAIRGLHGEDMTKLVAVASGEAFGAYLDARRDSPTRGRVVTAVLRPGTQVLVPPGVCNGFQALAESTQYLYCFDREWEPGMPGVAVDPLDPELGIPWPLPVDLADEAQLSAKDASLPSWAEVSATG